VTPPGPLQDQCDTVKEMPALKATYRIREVDSQEEDIAETLDELHRTTFFDSAPLPPFDAGYWWLVYRGTAPVAFAGMVQSTHAPNAGYLCRVGVIREHWGRSLQLRLLRAAACRARRTGWHSMVSDTTDNVISANNFIRAGYRLYRPRSPWGWPNTLYWWRSI
jgi:GNAT superfamily N-acetyltransferase